MFAHAGGFEAGFGKDVNGEVSAVDGLDFHGGGVFSSAVPLNHRWRGTARSRSEARIFPVVPAAAAIVTVVVAVVVITLQRQCHRHGRPRFESDSSPTRIFPRSI